MDDRRKRLAAALLLTAPCVPLLFMGEEWSAGSPFQYFTSFPDPQLGQLVREGRANDFQEFGWEQHRVPDPQAEETFHRSKLDWDEPNRPRHAAMLQWYRDLLGLRRRTPDLREPRLDAVHVDYDEQANWLVCNRGRISVACNFAGQAQSLPLPENGSRVGLLASDSAKLHSRRIDLPGVSVAIVGPA